MSNTAVFNALKKINAAYTERLHMISETQFQVTPPPGGWSYSEVYCHIFDASLLSLVPVEKCIAGKGEQKRTWLITKIILFAGRLPGTKYKMPKTLEPRVRKITKEEASFLIKEFTTKLSDDFNGMGQADPAVKNQHPNLGYLNASEWLRFIEIHLNHHLKQLKRIEKSF